MRRNSILFAAMVLLFCAWALSLPLFPTQDGPMHKYYVHAIASLLSGSQDYRAYTIRHPFPPYATHYALLLGLTRWLSFDMAEKLLVCLLFVATAYGVRYCAESMGPSGRVVSLCAVPLVLHWSLVMGFLNYSLAVALFFFAAGVWARSGPWLIFCLLCLLLAITHPIPLLMLIAFVFLDQLLRLVQGRGLRRREVFASLFATACFFFPLASVDRSRSVASLHAFGLHKDALISSLVLFGVSPFDTRSTNLWINVYRLGLVVLLGSALALAGSGVLDRWRSRCLRPGDSLALLAVAVLLAIPVLPAAMNGSDFFSQRLMIFPWLAALAAAGGYAAPARWARVVPVFAMVFAVTTLLPAEIFFRPVARDLAALEREPLPQHSQALALLDPGMLKTVRVTHQLGFNPYLWSGALPLLSANAVMLNSPFMDQKITPLMPAAGGNLLIDRIPSADDAERLINGNVNLPDLPAALRSPLLASTSVIVYVGAPAGQVAPGFPCSRHGWYLICPFVTHKW